MTFEASNGYTVETGENRLDLYRGEDLTKSAAVSEGQVQALREFFRDQEDKRLGRWRWPENPDYLVYPDDDDANYCGVLYEPGGGFVEWSRDEVAERLPTKWDLPARAYFDAHPEGN